MFDAINSKLIAKFILPYCGQSQARRRTFFRFNGAVKTGRDLLHNQIGLGCNFICFGHYSFLNDRVAFRAFSYQIGLPFRYKTGQYIFLFFNIFFVDPPNIIFGNVQRILQVLVDKTGGPCIFIVEGKLKRFIQNAGNTVVKIRFNFGFNSVQILVGESILLKFRKRLGNGFFDLCQVFIGECSNPNPKVPGHFHAILKCGN